MQKGSPEESLQGCQDWEDALLQEKVGGLIMPAPMLAAHPYFLKSVHRREVSEDG